MRISDWSSDVCSSDLLLRKQADVWEYRPCKLHMKLIVLDNVTYIGSANFDARSLFLNVAIMVRIADAEFAARMSDFFAGLEPDWQIREEEARVGEAGGRTCCAWG